jgi:hypothetical protein
MSKIKYTKDDKVSERKGEFFKIGSCYTTPRSIHPIPKDKKGYGYDDPLFAALELDVDELMNKPRRFFDHLLSIMEAKAAAGDKRAAYCIEGCEMWLSAVENGLTGEVYKLAERTDGKVWDEEKYEWVDPPTAGRWGG